jgi:hypothetical protein
MISHLYKCRKKQSKIKTQFGYWKSQGEQIKFVIPTNILVKNMPLALNCMKKKMDYMQKYLSNCNAFSSDSDVILKIATR